jgi:hypothetical protein
LVDLDIVVTDMLLDWLDLRRSIHRSSNLGIGGGQSERLLNLCRHFGANRYLSGNAAQSYLDVDLFIANGVTVEWQDYRHPEYSQLHGAFEPNLSALDLILNMGDESLAVIAKGATKEGRGAT